MIERKIVMKMIEKSLKELKRIEEEKIIIIKIEWL